MDVGQPSPAAVRRSGEVGHEKDQPGGLVHVAGLHMEGDGALRIEGRGVRVGTGRGYRLTLDGAVVRLPA